MLDLGAVLKYSKIYIFGMRNLNGTKTDFYFCGLVKSIVWALQNFMLLHWRGGGKLMPLCTETQVGFQCIVVP
jgi:hypothetical protein